MQPALKYCLIIALCFGTQAQNPANVNGGPTSPTTAFIFWSPVANAPSTHRYWYRQLNPVMTPWISQTNSHISLSRLTSGTSYRYQLQYCSNGENGCSATQNVKFKTYPATSDQGHIDKSLPVINKVIITPNSNSISIHWDQPKNDSEFGTYTGYMVSWCAQRYCNNATTTSERISTNNTVIENLNDNTQYNVVVRTTNGPFISPPRETTLSTTVGSMNARVLSISDTTAILSWNSLPSFVNSSKYWLRLSNQSWVSTNQTIYAFFDLQPDTDYDVDTQYCVNNDKKCGDIQYVNMRTRVLIPVSTTPSPTPVIPSVSNLEITRIDSHSMTLEWTGDSDCDSYSGTACADGCNSFSSAFTNHTITNLLDYTRYNVSVWCVLDNQPGSQSTTTGNTTLSSDLDNLTSVNDVDEISLSWEPKSRPLAPKAEVWVNHPVSKKWLRTEGANLSLMNLSSASFYEIEMQFCANGFQECAESTYYRTKTLPAPGERYDLDKTMANPTAASVIGTTTDSVNLNWTAVSRAIFYIVEARRCSARGCPLDKSITTRNTSTAVEGLEDLTRYNFTIRTVKQETGGVYYSSLGTQLTATTLPAPVTNVQATSLFSCIELRWDPKMSNTPHEYQYRRNTTSEWSRTRSNDLLIFNDLNRGSQYTFEVRFCGATCSPSSAVTVTF